MAQQSTFTLFGFTMRNMGYPAFAIMWVKDHAGAVHAVYPSGDIRVTKAAEEDLRSRPGFHSLLEVVFQYDPTNTYFAFEDGKMYIGPSEKLPNAISEYLVEKFHLNEEQQEMVERLTAACYGVGTKQ